jgi:hypothetical protein
MAFYDLEKSQRKALSHKIGLELRRELKEGAHVAFLKYFSDGDTYIRKCAYLQLGRLWKEGDPIRKKIIGRLRHLFSYENEKVRQTVINAAGEIGKTDFEAVDFFFDDGLFDKHHAPRNAVIGSIKKMGEVNPGPVLAWSRKYLNHPDKEVRREICHGIELRGRKHPQDILPMLKELEHDKTARVRNTLIHVLGQIAYKRGCLETVLKHLQGWKNKELVADALHEIVDVHDRYKNFAHLTTKEARAIMRNYFG